MIDTSTYSNFVYVSTIQTGCVTIEFDSSYPLHLIGIISRDEYQKSIQQINRVFSSNRMTFLVCIISGFCLVIGMTLVILGAALQVNSRDNQFPPITGAGITLLFCGATFALIGLCAMQYRRTKQLQQAIAKESLKYLPRTPISCSWKLETKMNWCGISDDGQYRRLIYRIIIDIGRPVTSSKNQQM
ncbi:unnamed protein product [Adineta ricciae]|uniref:Uncharacterized protein n=1 Tax=Adineta ricciae TaxID=249248 RepID=A0A814TAU4_ADIRI|nr:unnamed protein product [Adineta ricciae]CAF1453642.1 unnamed protein product [Adineta ricciae]